MTAEFKIPVRLFELGQLVATQGALSATTFDTRCRCLAKHVAGDWGCIDKEDWATNFDALMNGGRLLSAYPLDPSKPCEGWGENTLWIITEADRRVTTLLLPSEY